MDAISLAAAGMQAANQNFFKSADRVVSGQSNEAQETVEQIASKHAFQASLAVVQTADQMKKSLLDIKV